MLTKLLHFGAGHRTLLVNMVTLLTTVLAWPELTALLDPQTVVALLAGLNLALRFLTNGPVFQSHSTSGV